MSTNQAENTSEAMVIDPSLSPSKKRDRDNISITEQNTNILNPTMDEHMAVEMNSAIDSNTSIPADSASLSALPWSEVLHILSTYRNYEPGYLALSALPPTCTQLITEDISLEIQGYRERTYMPNTLARDQFDKWIQNKSLDELLTKHQQDTVLHFIDILYSEFCMELVHRTLADRTELINRLTHAHPQHEDEFRTLLPPLFVDYECAEHNNLHASTMAIIRTITHQHRQAFSWCGHLSEANQQLIEMILIDAPDMASPQDDWIPLDEPTLPTTVSTTYQWSVAKNVRSRRKTLPTPEDIARDPSFHSFLEASRAMRTHAVNTVMAGRSLGPTDRHPPDSDIAHILRPRTYADRFTLWGQYLYASGFYPSITADDTLTDLQYTVGRIGIAVDQPDYPMTVSNKLQVNEDWVRSNFVSNNWAMVRNAQDDKPAGYLIKLDKPALFGNFLFHDELGGAFAPYTYTVKSAMHDKRSYLFVAIPIHVPLAALQLPDVYPPVLATRGLPSQKDRTALTNAALATLHNILQRILAGQYAVLPVSNFQNVSLRSSRHRGNFSYSFVHPEQDERSRDKAGHKWVNDQIWEVVFIGTPQDRMAGTVHDRADEAKTAIFSELAKVRRGQHVLDPPVPSVLRRIHVRIHALSSWLPSVPQRTPGLLSPLCYMHLQHTTESPCTGRL